MNVFTPGFVPSTTGYTVSNTLLFLLVLVVGFTYIDYMTYFNFCSGQYFYRNPREERSRLIEMEHQQS